MLMLTLVVAVGGEISTARSRRKNKPHLLFLLAGSLCLKCELSGVRSVYGGMYTAT